MNSSLAAYVIAGVFLLTFGGVFLVTKKTKIVKDSLVIIGLFYYLWMLIWSWDSNIFFMSAYYGVSGVLMIYFCMCYIEYNKCFDNETQLKNVINLMLLVFLSYFVGGIYFEIIYRGKSLMDGIPLGFGAVLYYFVVFYTTKSSIDKSKLIYIPVIILAVLIGLYFKSLSAFMAYFVCLIMYLFFKRKYLLLSFGIGLAIVLMALMYNFLMENEGTDTVLLGKSVNAIITGSGRFQVYAAAWDVLKNYDLLTLVKGVGFMTERTVLARYDLAWSTDVHNSFLLSIVTGGVVAAILYFLFVLSPLFVGTYTSKDAKSLFISFHFMCVFFGLSSSYYLGRPSYLLILSILLYSAVTSRREKCSL
ncbi:O-antigen ligase family protein [Vibrio mimicus]